MIKLKKRWVLVIVIAAIFLVAIGVFYGMKSKGEKSAKLVTDKTITFINENLLAEGTTASYVSMIEESGIYKLKVKVGTAEPEVYVTKDGKLLFIQGVIDMSPATTTEEQTEGQTTTEVQKSDRPDVKLFVMSYCPYGLQAEKMYLPVYNLLKNKADMGIYFVSYIMHEKKEIDENLRQYCIQKEQNAKYYGYLGCFVKAGEYEACLTEANIDKTKLASCVANTDAQYKITDNYNDKSTWLNGNYPKFDVNADLNEQYGVQGSPTIVINGVVVSISTRSPEKFKEAICQAFNSVPEECSQALSEDAASVSFGDTGSTSGGSCE